MIDLGDIDRPSHGESPLIQLVVVARAADGVVGERVGVQERPLHEFVRAAVQLIGSALHRHRHHAASVAAILRIVGAGHHLELLHRVHRRHVRDAVRCLVDHVVRRAIEQELRARRDAAVNRPARKSAIRKARERGVVGRRPDHAWRQRGQHDGNPRQDRQPAHVPLTHHQTAIRLLRVEQLRLRGDSDRLRLRSHLHGDVERGRLTQRQQDALARERTEPGHLHRQPVSSRINEQQSGIARRRSLPSTRRSRCRRW